jgi:hypothetical protein
MSVVRSNSYANSLTISACHAACESGANLRVCQRILPGSTGVVDIVTRPGKISHLWRFSYADVRWCRGSDWSG